MNSYQAGDTLKDAETSTLYEMARLLHLARSAGVGRTTPKVVDSSAAARDPLLIHEVADGGSRVRNAPRIAHDDLAYADIRWNLHRDFARDDPRLSLALSRSIHAFVAHRALSGDPRSWYPCDSR